MHITCTVSLFLCLNKIKALQNLFMIGNAIDIVGVTLMKMYHSVFSPAEAMDYAFKRLDTDISLEAQVPLSSDLLKSTAIQVIGTGGCPVGFGNII